MSGILGSFAGEKEPAQLRARRVLLPATEQAENDRDKSDAACKPETPLTAGCQAANVESVPVVPSADTTSTAEVDHKSKHNATRKSKEAAGSSTPRVKRHIVKINNMLGAHGGVCKLPGKTVLEKIGLHVFARRHVWYH